MAKSKILIVEDEIIIAGTIQRYLKRMDFDVVGIVISYEEAIEVLKSKKVDLALLDIRLSGTKTGIEVAKYIKSNLDIPHIYLTSQLNPVTLQAAKETFPAGYLSKPIQKESLYATIEIALFNYQQKVNLAPLLSPIITLTSNGENYKTRIEDILYIKSEHVYANVYLKENKRPLLVRKSLKLLKEELPQKQFVQPHRSYLVNIDCISSWDKNSITVETATTIAISRNNKDAILTILKNT